jgi:hypothetical protein
MFLTLENTGWVEHPRAFATALAFNASGPLVLTIPTEALMMSSFNMTVFLGIK